MLKILGRISSINVRKVLWTCAEIGIPYSREDWGMGFKPTRAPEFLALNPNGLVPVIEDENGILWESNTICRYLAGKHGRADLLPSAPRERARVEQWMDWQSTELNGTWRYAFWALARKDPKFSDQAQIEASVHAWNEKMGILERQLERTGAYAAGSSFTLADILLGLSVNRWVLTPMATRVDCPAALAYYERLKARPAFRDFGPNGIP